MNQLEIEPRVVRSSVNEHVLEIATNIINNSDFDILLLKTNLPMNERLEAPLFSVRMRNGELSQYRGIMVKRGMPRPEDYMLLKAGSRVSFKTNIYRDYVFQPGLEYSVMVDLNYIDIQPVDKAGRLPRVESRTIQLKM